MNIALRWVQWKSHSLASSLDSSTHSIFNLVFANSKTVAFFTAVVLHTRVFGIHPFITRISGIAILIHATTSSAIQSAVLACAFTTHDGISGEVANVKWTCRCIVFLGRAWCKSLFYPRDGIFIIAVTFAERNTSLELIVVQIALFTSAAHNTVRLVQFLARGGCLLKRNLLAGLVTVVCTFIWYHVRWALVATSGSDSNFTIQVAVVDTSLLSFFFLSFGTRFV